VLSESSTGSLNKDKEGAVVIVDPFSTGAHLAAGVCAMGYVQHDMLYTTYVYCS
jgi:hypothetical protein